MKRPNPLSPDRMTPAERRAALCGLLAQGLVRLRARQSSGISADGGDSSLHFPPDRSGHATASRRHA
jgi:hypothetical protein